MKYWNKLQDQIRDGTAPECFVKQLAESNYQEKGISEIQAAYLSGCIHSLTPSPSPFPPLLLPFQSPNLYDLPFAYLCSNDRSGLGDYIRNPQLRYPPPNRKPALYRPRPPRTLGCYSPRTGSHLRRRTPSSLYPCHSERDSES